MVRRFGRFISRMRFCKVRLNYPCVHNTSVHNNVAQLLISGLIEYEDLNPPCDDLGVDKRRWEHRNHWLSEYILQKTGALRRRKQVGSRMQTLKKSWKGTARKAPSLSSRFLGILIYVTHPQAITSFVAHASDEGQWNLKGNLKAVTILFLISPKLFQHPPEVFLPELLLLMPSTQATYALC